MAGSEQQKKPDLKAVPNVERLHSGKEHLNTLIERLDFTILEFGDQVRAEGQILTFAEIIGSIECLKHYYLTGRKA